MDDKFTVRKATENDISLIENLIKGLAAYEKRPQDMTAAQEDLRYLLFERNMLLRLSQNSTASRSDMLFITPYSPHLRQRRECILKICFYSLKNAGADSEQSSFLK